MWLITVFDQLFSIKIINDLRDAAFLLAFKTDY